MDFLTIIVCILAGAGAGLGTGFAGMSAAAVITPMLTAFLGFDTYAAVGIALISDVPASAVAAYTYWKNDNIDIKNGLAMMISILIFTTIGSYIATKMPTTTMGILANIVTAFMGIKFLARPTQHYADFFKDADDHKRILRSLIGGAVVGSICGYIGAGGGMMMLFVLNIVLGYELKLAVGTSVLIMTATAFTGAFSHFHFGGKPNFEVMAICIVSTLVFARIAAVIANKVSSRTANICTGIILLLLEAVIVTVKYIL